MELQPAQMSFIIQKTHFEEVTQKLYLCFDPSMCELKEDLLSPDNLPNQLYKGERIWAITTEIVLDWHTCWLHYISQYCHM
jgi:hypothetical protein